MVPPVFKTGVGLDEAEDGSIPSRFRHRAWKKIPLPGEPAPTKHVPQPGIHRADQFAVERVDTKQEDMLCVPSLKKP